MFYERALSNTLANEGTILVKAPIPAFSEDYQVVKINWLYILMNDYLQWSRNKKSSNLLAVVQRKLSMGFVKFHLI